MSDYVDTVDIEGVQYDIQDTQTKEALDELEAGQVYSTTAVDTGAKYMGNKAIYRKTIIFTLPSTGNANFPANDVNLTVPIEETCTGFVNAFGFVVAQNGVRVPLGMALNAQQWTNFWLRTNAHPNYPNTIGVAVSPSFVSLTAALTILFTKD